MYTGLIMKRSVHWQTKCLFYLMHVNIKVECISPETRQNLSLATYMTCVFN